MEVKDQEATKLLWQNWTQRRIEGKKENKKSKNIFTWTTPTFFIFIFSL